MKVYPSIASFLAELKNRRKGVLRTSLNALIKNKIIDGITLDVGVGRKTLSSYYDVFANRTKAQLTLDLNPEYEPHILGDALSLPVKNNSIDTVICFNLLEHVPEPAKVLAEIARVLKKGGKAYIFSPYLTPLHTNAPKFAYDHSRLSHKTYEYWCKKFFTNARIYPVAYGPFTAALVMLEQLIPYILQTMLIRVVLQIDVWYTARRQRYNGQHLLAVYAEVKK